MKNFLKMIESTSNVFKMAITKAEFETIDNESVNDYN